MKETWIGRIDRIAWFFILSILLIHVKQESKLGHGWQMRVLEQGNPLQVAPEPLVVLRSPPCPFVDFFFGRRGSAFTPHRISLRLTARLLRLPLKGGAIGLGARASRPHPCSLWGLLSISATLQAATTSAGTATAGSKESQGAVGSIQVREKAEAVPGLVRAGRPRSQEAFDRTINREHGLHPAGESSKTPYASLADSPSRGE